MAYCKKYKAYILKYVPCILKYMPCIFGVFKCLKNNDLQNGVFEVFFAVFQPSVLTAFSTAGNGVPHAADGVGMPCCFMPGNADGNPD